MINLADIGFSATTKPSLNKPPRVPSRSNLDIADIGLADNLADIGFSATTKPSLNTPHVFLVDLT